MAAPASKTLRDLNGKWKLNSKLSDNPEAALALQGISWITRKAIAAATVTIAVKQYTGPPKPLGKDHSQPAPHSNESTHIDIAQSASGLKGNEELRCLDGVEREHSDWVFGTAKATNWWIDGTRLKEIAKEQSSDWLAEGWDPKEADEYLWNLVESVGNGWTAGQIWGFQIINGERRYTRKILVKNGAKVEKLLFVYDFLE